MLRRSALVLVVWVFAAQIAAAVHASSPHSDDASKCGDPSSHFCAFDGAEHPHSCILCRLNVQGAPGGVEEKAISLQSSEPVLLVKDRPAPTLFLSPSASPRAPPVA